MANGTFGGGVGTLLDPYRVEDAQDMNAVRNNLSAHYIQTTDIDLSAYPDWAPIGFDVSFTGGFNGNGYLINNLAISTGSSAPYIGLFGMVGGTAHIQQVNIKDCSISVSATDALGRGALIGYAFGSVLLRHCSSTGVIYSSGGNAGGLFGRIDGATIKSCWSSCDVTSASSRAGGLVGILEGCIVENSYATGDVSGTTYVGGFCGEINPTYNSRASSVLNCYASGTVTGSSQCAGFTYRVTHNRNLEISVKNCFALNDAIRRVSTSVSGDFVDFVFSIGSKVTLENNYSLDSMQFIQLQ